MKNYLHQQLERSKTLDPLNEEIKWSEWWQLRKSIYTVYVL